MQKEGITGVAAHPIEKGLVETLSVYQRFDFLGDGETWMLDSYLDPTAALRPTLDQMFDTIAARGRTKDHFLAYLLNVDVVSHLGGLDPAVATLVEIDRRIRAFKADHRRPYHFTIFSDHGNAHLRSRLVDPKKILTDVGVRAVDALTTPVFTLTTPIGDTAGGDSPPLEAVPVVHVRVNYVAVHATGTLRVLEDPDELRSIVQASVAAYEAPLPQPWQLEPGEYLERMLKQIVGFRIEIERLDGAWKLSQNHPAERRERVIRALDENPKTQPVAELMREAR